MLVYAKQQYHIVAVSNVKGFRLSGGSGCFYLLNRFMDNTFVQTAQSRRRLIYRCLQKNSTPEIIKVVLYSTAWEREGDGVWVGTNAGLSHNQPIFL